MLIYALNYFLRLPPALENKDVSVNVFNTNPVGERQSGVSPNPVHHRPQLGQEGNQAETGESDKSIKIFLGANGKQITNTQFGTNVSFYQVLLHATEGRGISLST